MIRSKLFPSGLYRMLGAILLAPLLGACGGGGDDTSSLASPVDINGSVGDGPVTGATILVHDINGNQVGSGISDSKASFKISVKASRHDYPLILSVIGGFDLVTSAAPDFEMSSVMLSPSDKRVNINPFTTLMVKMAQDMPGGLNAQNIQSAKAIVMDKLGFGLDPGLVADPVSTRITDANVANIIKSSEALGEMVRRTRDTSSAAGKPISGDGVMDALAADMVDGFLDGAGAAGTSMAVAAIANVVSAQVLVEALSNNLKVGGIVATRVIDQAIITTHPDIASSNLTDSVRITGGMLRQTKAALAAVQVLDLSSQVTEISNTVNEINAYSLPAEVEVVLPADTSIYLDDAVMNSATASDQEMVAINQMTSTFYGGDTTTVGGDTTTVGGDTTTVGGDTTTVVQKGSLSLNWNAPATRADGTSLSLAEIGGYRIYYGETSGSYTGMVDQPDGAAQSITLNDIEVGNYYISMTTYDLDGRESYYSEEIIKAVN